MINDTLKQIEESDPYCPIHLRKKIKPFPWQIAVCPDCEVEKTL